MMNKMIRRIGLVATCVVFAAIVYGDPKKPDPKKTPASASTKEESAKKPAEKKDQPAKTVATVKQTTTVKETTSSSKSVEKRGQEAENFIQELGDKAIKNLTGKELSREERNKKFEGMFVKAFDYEKIAKFVLGRNRRDAKPDEMQEYIPLFKSTIVSTYAARFGEYQQEKFKVHANRIVNKDVDTIIVSSQIIRPDGSKIAIEWHLYEDKNKELKIFDVVVEGVSMALTQRSEFNAILQREGSLRGLNNVLKNRQK